MQIDNLVGTHTRSLEFPDSWLVVDLKRKINGLFKNDDVTYLLTKWRVYEIRNGGRRLVLRPI